MPASAQTADTLLASLDGCASGKKVVQVVMDLARGPERLSPEQLELLCADLSSKATTSAGALAVHVALQARLPKSLCEIAQTHPSHGVATRAVTALLRLGEVQEVKDLVLSVDSGLSAARQVTALQALTRFSPKRLAGILSGDFINLMISRFSKHLAARLLARCSDEEVVKHFWPELSKVMPSKAAMSLATRMPAVMLQMLLTHEGGQQLQHRRGPRDLTDFGWSKVIAMAVAASDESVVLGYLDAKFAQDPRNFFQSSQIASIVAVLLRKPESALPAMRRWLQATEGMDSVALHKGSGEQWCVELQKVATKDHKSEEIQTEAWAVTLEWTLRSIEICSSWQALQLLRAIHQPTEGKSSTNPFTADQLRRLFRVLLQAPQQVGNIMNVLKEEGWHSEEQLDVAMLAELTAIKEGTTPEAAAPSAPPQLGAIMPAPGAPLGAVMPPPGAPLGEVMPPPGGAVMPLPGAPLGAVMPPPGAPLGAVMPPPGGAVMPLPGAPLGAVMPLPGAPLGAVMPPPGGAVMPPPGAPAPMMASQIEVKLPLTLPAHVFQHWPRKSRTFLLRQMAPLKKPPTEVAGAGPPTEYLHILGHLPFEEAFAELVTRSNSSNAQARQAVLVALIECAGREEASKETDAILQVLQFFEKKLRNEQDDVRALILRNMTNTVAVRSWSECHVPPLRSIFTFSLQAKGTSAHSMNAWQQFTEVLLTNGLAGLSHSAGPSESLGPVGDFGMEVMKMLKDANHWRHQDPDLGSALLRRLEGLANDSKWESHVCALDWAVQKWLLPAVATHMQKKELEQGCKLLALWEGMQHQLGCDPSPALVRAIEDAFATVRSQLSAMLPPEQLYRSAMMTWPQDAGGRLKRPRVQRRALRRRPMHETLPLPASSPIMEAQREAVRLLSESLSRQTLFGFFAQVAEKAMNCSTPPRNVILALDFLQNLQGHAMESRDPTAHQTLVQAVCTSWGRLTDDQRTSIAPRMLNTAGRQSTRPALRPLLQTIADWQFPLDEALKERLGSERRSTLAAQLSQRLRLRSDAQHKLLPDNRDKRREVRRSMLARWRQLPVDSQVELFATSPDLCRTLQITDPSGMKIFLPGGAASTSKLEMLKQLQQQLLVPLHMFQDEPGIHGGRRPAAVVGGGGAQTAPLLHWPRSLQQQFAEFWLLPMLTQEALAIGKGASAQTMQAKAVALLMRFSVSDLSPIASLVQYCTEVLSGEGNSSEELMLRGSAGALLDLLMQLLPKADMPGAVIDIVADQVGRGASKQAVRSLQKLLRRLSPSQAGEHLQQLLSKERLKVAERVAMVRLLGNFLGASAVKVLERLWADGSCHRDVGGAVLVQLCHPSICSDASMELLASVCRRAVDEEKLLYPLQVVLQHLQTSPPAADATGGRILSTLSQVCKEAACPAGLRGPATSTLLVWAKKTCIQATQGGIACIPIEPRPEVSAETMVLVTEVAQCMVAILMDFGPSSSSCWKQAAECLLQTAVLNGEPLKSALGGLLECNDASPGSQAARRLSTMMSSSMDSHWHHLATKAWEACAACAMLLMTPRASAPGGAGCVPASAQWAIHLWAFGLQWSVPGQPVAFLMWLPPPVLAEPSLLHIIAAEVKASFSTPTNTFFTSKQSPHLQHLQIAAEALLQLKDSVGSAAMAMLIPIVRHAAETLELGWSGWRSEAMRGALALPNAPIALQLLWLDVSLDGEDAKVEIDASPPVGRHDDDDSRCGTSDED